MFSKYHIKIVYKAQLSLPNSANNTKSSTIVKKVFDQCETHIINPSHNHRPQDTKFTNKDI